MSFIEEGNLKEISDNFYQIIAVIITMYPQISIFYSYFSF